MRTSSRTATVLFTDVVASTELTRRLGDASHRVRTRYFAALRNALAVHHGQEVKTLGDGIMAVFPSAHAALECAIAMQQDLAATDNRHPEAAFEQRIGVSVGDVREEAGDYFGTAVIEAARLCAAAGAGEILVSDVVHALVEDAFEMQRRDPLQLKGIEGARAVWQLEWDPRPAGALRVALAEDSVLLREGMARVLEAEGFEVVVQASDADELIQAIPGARPHVVVLDVRMPPTHTTEGLRAAHWLHAEYPDMGILMLSQAVTVAMARRLLDGISRGVGYLLKERVGDIDELVTAIRTVAGGGRAIEPSIVAALAEDQAAADLELNA
jgi:class 3 adenylate cyclase/DNA-binding NarL/FixJ family response regulator